MKFLGNFIWIIFGGLISSICWFLAGILLCITIVFIPFGRQCFKISNLVLWPFGSEVDLGNFGAFGLVGNIIWLVLFGWELCLGHFTIGLIYCITIVGIPFGLQHFKFARLALIPFGAKIIR
ncbi:hypothetical protein SH1V18_23120 [Vallitalea longa]|uniref:Inner membrane component domain-containing protein n=1 Tax=Vallitalea longa TaxID=2936439 RepID=A0A9W5YAD1_9FIRM|nr:YccF domain-containing protein [Vallitalea longa]GKX29832.1 hypothetical protein SH1V18_23120 [Vallitalea longa]